MRRLTHLRNMMPHGPGLMHNSTGVLRWACRGTACFSSNRDEPPSVSTTRTDGECVGPSRRLAWLRSHMDSGTHRPSSRSARFTAGGSGVQANLVPDAHLAALAIEHGLMLCSTDGDFGRFSNLRWQNPLVD